MPCWGTPAAHVLRYNAHPLGGASCCRASVQGTGFQQHRRLLRPCPPPQALLHRSVASKQAWLQAELLHNAERIIR